MKGHTSALLQELSRPQARNNGESLYRGNIARLIFWSIEIAPKSVVLLKSSCLSVKGQLTRNKRLYVEHTKKRMYCEKMTTIDRGLRISCRKRVKYGWLVTLIFESLKVPCSMSIAGQAWHSALPDRDIVKHSWVPTCMIMLV